MKDLIIEDKQAQIKKGDCASATITFSPIIIISYIFIKNKTVILKSVMLELLYGFGYVFPADFIYGRWQWNIKIVQLERLIKSP
ncbi:MAG: hypothetical protein H6Q59_2008 [Firmicutes bacterium]|nr:hypothetical protein [Bacillota bacterium]